MNGPVSPRRDILRDWTRTSYNAVNIEMIWYIIYVYLILSLYSRQFNIFICSGFFSKVWAEEVYPIVSVQR